VLIVTVTKDPSVNVQVDVSDATSGIGSLSVNGETAIPGTDGTFRYTLSLVPGLNALTVVATDRAGNTTTDFRTIMYDPEAPVLTITNPVGNRITKNADLLLMGEMSENA
jgi:hypothetical protein